MSNVKRGTGFMHIYSESGISIIKSKVKMKNKLWCFTDQGPSKHYNAAIVKKITAFIQ